MIRKIILYIHTIRHLKGEQIIGQIYHRFRSKFLNQKKLWDPGEAFNPEAISLFAFQRDCVLNQDHNLFTFLNQTSSFQERINWNDLSHGKLWNYHLQYAYFLHDAKADLLKKKTWLLDISQNIIDGIVKLEPFPVSIRLIQTLSFLNALKKMDETILRAVRMQSVWLKDNLEIHIGANHLLVNRISLALCSICCNWKDQEHFQIALSKELNKQILSDGAHYERSPMYQLDILELLLTLYSACLAKQNRWSETYKNYICKMAAWMQAMSNEGDVIPPFQDSTGDLRTKWISIKEAIQSWNIPIQQIILNSSGYRKWTQDNECFWINAGNISPTHQPGHAHADMMHFIWYSRNLPVIQDRSISTYEESPIRLKEKSTHAHNTVSVCGKEQSEMWSSFRVGRRAKLRILEEQENYLKGWVTSPLFHTCNHERSFQMLPGKMMILDHVSSCSEDCLHKAYFHLDHRWSRNAIKIEQNSCSFASFRLEFEYANSVYTESYIQALDYNLSIESIRIVVQFRHQLNTTLRWND